MILVANLCMKNKYLITRLRENEKKSQFCAKKNKLETNRITQSSQAVMALSQHEKVLGKVKVKALSL